MSRKGDTMKAIVVDFRNVLLKAETDSDRALLNVWVDRNVRVSSSIFVDGKTTEVLIEFLEEKENKK